MGRVLTKHVCISREEEILLETFCGRMGWTPSRVFQVALYDFFVKHNMITEALSKPSLGNLVDELKEKKSDVGPPQREAAR